MDGGVLALAEDAADLLDLDALNANDDSGTDPDELTDDELDAMAATALHAVMDQRDRTHDAAALALLLLLARLSVLINSDQLADLYDPGADRATNRAALAAEIERQAHAVGLHADWVTTARNAHTSAALAGAAAASHVLTAGGVSVDPGPSPFDDPFDATGWVSDQAGGLAGDLVRVYESLADAVEAEEAEFADVQAGLLITQGDGALYYLDEQVSNTYMQAAADVYAAVGLTLLYWNALGGACSICLGYESNSPYSIATLPSPPHGGCRCFTTPG